MAQPVKQQAEDGPYSLLQIKTGIADIDLDLGPRPYAGRPLCHIGENPSVNRNAHRKQSVEAIMTAAITVHDGSQHGQRRHDKYDRLVAAAQSVPRLKVAVVHPCDQASMSAVF